MRLVLSLLLVVGFAAEANAGFHHRFGPMTCGPVSCAPVSCAPVSCVPISCRPVSCLPVSCAPVSCAPRVLHAGFLCPGVLHARVVCAGLLCPRLLHAGNLCAACMCPGHLRPRRGRRSGCGPGCTDDGSDPSAASADRPVAGRPDPRPANGRRNHRAVRGAIGQGDDQQPAHQSLRRPAGLSVSA